MSSGPTDPGEPIVIVLEDSSAVSIEAADRVALAVAGAIGRRGRADLLTTGGSTPAGIYRELPAALARRRATWGAVHVWFGDERYVGRGDPLANVRLVDEVLVRSGHGPGSTIADANVHAVPVDEAMAAGQTAAWCAARYAEEIRATVPLDPDGLPLFDLILVGVGLDGHILSVFPGSPAIDADELVISVPPPEYIPPHVARITLNPAVLRVTPNLLVVAHGKGKAAIIEAVLTGPRAERQYPAQVARRSGATWLLDRAAADLLGPR